MSVPPRTDQRSSATYLLLLFAIAIIFCLFNLFNGFGEDSDSVRTVEAALQSFRYHTLLPSRSWGYPLYEAMVYPLIRFGSPGLLPAKLLSLLFLLGSAFVFFRIVLRLGLPTWYAFLVSIVFISNPVVIISGNSILETGLNLLLLLICLYYFICTTPGKILTLTNYAWYGILFGLANLARPDNMLYFGAVFLFLFSRKEFNIPGILLSGILFLALGIGPYYLIHYPIFHTVAEGVRSNVFSVAKNFVALFGLPLLALLAAGVIFRFSALRPVFKKMFVWKNETVRFLLILSAVVAVRVFKLADELEYGILIWPVFLIILTLAISEMATIWSPAVIRRFLGLCIVASFLPNLVQVYFFKEKDYQYKFSAGVNAGVFKQEKERRILNESVYHYSENVLMEASDSLRDKNLAYSRHIHYTVCDTCLVLTNMRELMLHKKNEPGAGSDLAKKRLVYAPDFNVSRGWRNFIKDNDLPPFSANVLKMQY